MTNVTAGFDVENDGEDCEITGDSRVTLYFTGKTLSHLYVDLLPFGHDGHLIVPASDLTAGERSRLGRLAMFATLRELMNADNVSVRVDQKG